MIRRPPRSTLSSSSAASDVYKRQVLCAEEQEVAGAKSFEGNRDELRILKSLLVTVPLQKHAVLAENPLHEPRAVEPEGRRAAPHIGRAEEAAAEREPFGRG